MRGILIMAREIIYFENATIFFRNFAGVGNENNPNPNHKRSFALKLTPEEAEDFRAKGFNVKSTKPKNPDYVPTEYLEIEVSYRKSAPAIYVYKGNQEIFLDESSVKAMDGYDIESIDVAFAPSHWEYMGRSGEKAYLSELRAVVRESPWDRKYAQYRNVVPVNQADTDTPF
jgi:hypothetical protein